ncbi:MAG: hypothetical protein R2856_08225 [Caldilineaceae bacterium]
MLLQEDLRTARPEGGCVWLGYEAQIALAEAKASTQNTCQAGRGEPNVCRSSGQHHIAGAGTASSPCRHSATPDVPPRSWP